ncbi:GTPase [Desulfonema limicola]|uniref:GTPase HflX n=1 Tax=Desulfonema limicola TaxID=45656 RepID=A0A975GGK7_9BACT|nr:GTPase HflX [Desulfonema limicola]QTA80353.1 GTPase [Desulfonema limicola]
MEKVYGNILGLKSGQIQRLESFYGRRIPNEYIISPDLGRDLVQISHEIRRQIGLLINRSGKIVCLVVGDAQEIVIPDTPDYRTIPGRLKGLRCVHTHLDNTGLSSDDLTDLALLRLDMMAAITMTLEGKFDQIHIAHILPKGSAEKPFALLSPLDSGQLNIDCLELVKALETELAQIRSLYSGDPDQERAILVSVSTQSRKMAEDSLAELKDLAESGGIYVVETIMQQRKKADPRFLMGKGKLEELNLLALRLGINLLIFDQELNPSQIRSITDQIDLKIIDRTQLILDIFAQRAQTREGKLQVEHAQLRYMLPRLVTKNTAMSRLTGGIGGRGPGETKLEINRRRVRERINRLEKALKNIIKQRKQQKSRRTKRGIPVISIVGYTNAGKSTLLNTLTQSRVLAENRLFATLDPSSRRLRFPTDREVIITDTVGFIRDLPKDLMTAFRATLEELHSADLLLHVIDISNPRFEDQVKSVEGIIADLDLQDIKMIRVMNKKDLIDIDSLEIIQRNLKGIAVSAKDRSSLLPLIEAMESQIENMNFAA